MQIPHRFQIRGQAHSPSWALALGLFCGPHSDQRLLWSVQVSKSEPTCEEGPPREAGTRALWRLSPPPAQA